MKIGIDLDDVVFEFTRELLKEYNLHYSTNFKFEDVFSYYFSEVLKNSPEEIMFFIKTIFNKDKNQNLSLCDGAKDSIITLAKKHEIYFITSRIIQEGTQESLNAHFSSVPFNLIFSANPYAGTPGKTKGEICLEAGIKIMIEDSKKHAEECSSKGIKTILIHKPWNIQANSENLIRVNNWNEIVNLIQKENEY
jgi:uncharacterized HAD superfamily protein